MREKSSLPPESNIEVVDVIDAKGSETPSEERLSRELTAGCEVSASRSGAAAACEYGTQASYGQCLQGPGCGAVACVSSTCAS